MSTDDDPVIMGRPRTGKRMIHQSFMLPVDLVDAIDRIAKQRQETRGAAARRLLREAVTANEPKIDKANPRRAKTAP